MRRSDGWDEKEGALARVEAVELSEEEGKTYRRLEGEGSREEKILSV